MDSDKKSGKKKRSSTTIVLSIMIAVLGCIMIYAGYRFISALLTYNSAREYYAEVRELFVSDDVEDPTGITEINPDNNNNSDNNGNNPHGQISSKTLNFRFDFSKLLAINPEAIGYLKMRGSDKDEIVDYPVVQGTDNSYYLTHMFNGEANKSGAIFMDYDIKDRFEARNCIIYGHNMYAGAKMFGCLSNYADYDYAAEHSEMDVYTEDKHYVYKVFSAFTADTNGFAYQYGFADDDDFMRFINDGLNSRTFDMGVGIEDFSADSHIITLSTCLKDYRDDKRYVVMLVRTEELDY